MNEAVNIENAVICFHCGEICEDQVVKKDHKTFCCNGCSAVYSILRENELSIYYDLEKAPGIKRSNTNRKNKFAFLEDPEIKEAFLRYKRDGMAVVVLRIPGIHCSSCIWLLENLYKLSGHIFSSTVNFTRKEATIRFDEDQLSFRSLVELLASVGYEPEINLDSSNSQQNNLSQNHSLYFKIGVAGFCFGNIMLLSFPEYLGLEDIGNIAFTRLFGYLNILLALPVFLYCSSDYYRSAWVGLQQKRLNLDLPISIGIITLFTRSCYEILSATGAGYMDSLAGLLFFMLIGKWFQNRTYQQLSFERDYKSYFPLAVTYIKNGKTEQLRIEKVEKGDQLKIYHEELIPADAYLLSDAAEVDYSFVSGESAPVPVEAGQLIYAGGRLKSASVKVEVKNKVSQSYLTSLWNDSAFNYEKLKEEMLADQLSKYFTPVVLCIAALSGLYWGQYDWGTAALVFTAVLIVACPCALALSTPFTLGNALRILGRNKFYLKNTAVIEKIARAKQIVFDKTGTLSLSSEAEVSFEGVQLSEEEKSWIAALCRQSSHPVSRMIAKFLDKEEAFEIWAFEEQKGAGLKAYVDGQLIKIGSAEFIGIKSSNTSGSKSYVSVNQDIIGCFKFQYQYRKGLSDLLTDLHKYYKLSLLSGDYSTDKTRLQSFFGKETPMLFQQSPHDKLRYIESLQKNGARAIMVGDGLNDAGALKKSDVGIAVADDINNFSPACDAIIDGKTFEKLGEFLDYARKSMGLVKAAFVISLMYNSVGIAFAVAGLLSPLLAAILMPLSSVSIVAFGSASTWLLAKVKHLDQPDMETKRRNT